MPFRSENEKRFASWLKRNGFIYQYEKLQFVSKRGRTYTPDFYIDEQKVIIEIKPLSLIPKEFDQGKRRIVEEQLKKYQSMFFIVDMPANTPEVYKAFDGYSDWLDTPDKAKALFEKIFNLSTPLPSPRSQPNANLERIRYRPTTQDERDNLSFA